MDAKAMLITIAVMLSISFVLMDQLKFLAPARSFHFRESGWALAIFFGVLFLNFLGAFVVIRKFLLKGTAKGMVIR